MRALTKSEVRSVAGGSPGVTVTGTRPGMGGNSFAFQEWAFGYSSWDFPWMGYCLWDSGDAGFEENTPEVVAQQNTSAQPSDPSNENLEEVVVTTTMVPKISYAEVPMLQFSADDWLCQFGGPAFSVPIEYEQIETVTITGRAYHVAASKIFDHEGPLKLSPTPTEKEHHLTVGHGFDLTEHNATDLKNMGLSKALIEKLSPYLGKTGDATDLPKDLLKLSPADAKTISNLALAFMIKEVEKIYENASGRQFEDLPSNVQTVAVDLAYMRGPDGFPRFMGHLVTFDPTKPDYTEMKYELTNFWGKNANPDTIKGLKNRTDDDLRILLPTGK